MGVPTVAWKNPVRGRSRYYLRILTALTCGVFVFVFYFVNGVQQQVKMQVVERLESQAIEYRQRCVWPIYWAGQSSKYTVLYNFVPADTVFEYNASVTYTTHGTTEFLKHVEHIAQRWNGPVSLAAYAPATDFEDTLAAIQYLRQCGSPFVRQFTTFHLFFDTQFKPSVIPCSLDDYLPSVDCDTFTFPNRTFQSENNLTYPVNVARNIARISAQTQYVLPSDIELYPSVNLIPMFLEMLARERETAAAATNKSGDANATTGQESGNATSEAVVKAASVAQTRTVYILPLFEVDEALSAPENKSELMGLMKKEKVVPFHKFVCPECHRVPKQDDWFKYVPNNGTLGVLYTTKRHKPFQNWEPIYIGTNDEPLYDERLNWEGMSDKMTQAYEMCLLDYNFSVLDNAFLVHAPGIKRYNKTLSQWRKGYVTQNGKLRKQIKKELTSKYAANAKCSL